MTGTNFLLQESVENIFDPKPAIAECKKVLNICKLSKYKSGGECGKFYDGFFLSRLEGPNTFKDFSAIYTGLLNDDVFVSNLCTFMVYWQPKDTTGLFQPLVHIAESELRQMKKNRIRYLSDVKALFQFLQHRFESIGNTLKPQTFDQKAIVFLTTVQNTIQNFIFYFNKKIQDELSDQTSPEDIQYVVRGEGTQGLEEDVVELLDLLEHAEEWIQNYIDHDTTTLDEAVVNKAVEKAKLAKVKADKATKAFNELVTKKIKKIREDRRNRRHAEIVGETLRINETIKRLMKAGGLAIINPAIGIIYYIISIVIDKKTAASDRAILIGQVEDELEIIEEKISIAERNGDDKGKIELMRLRQRLEREYKRISRVKYDKNK